MSNEHPLKKILAHREKGPALGIYSACTADAYVIEACMERAIESDTYALIEATANQVNQFGGYTGMKPADYRDYVFKLAQKTGLPLGKVILGGDHLGPLTWKNEISDSAMEKSKELIRQYILAGFTKIHIDTSMHLGDDNADIRLDDAVIAERGAILCKEAENAFSELKKTVKNSIDPVYVVGSEVPIPGGSQNAHEGVQVTQASDFENTLNAFQTAFMKHGLQKAWQNIIAIVVQPGVEFGDESIHEYCHEDAKELIKVLKKHPELVFEGHSTDYQLAHSLKQMVVDGIAILKVGPALTFALREALFSLSYMEYELFKYNPAIQLSNFIETLDSAMVQSPENWIRHYHGDPAKIRFARKFSYSDRARYYLSNPDVRKSIEQMIINLDSVQIPMTLIDQYMPIQYMKIRRGQIMNNARALLKDRIENCIDDYIYATRKE